MGADEAVQEYYDLSLRYLLAAENNLDEEIFEPAMSNAIHALELSIKSALSSVIDDPIKTHNVGGLFGQHFRDTVGDERCKQINFILTKYNFPRYPGEDEVVPDDVRDDIATIKEFIEVDIHQIIGSKNSEG